MDQKQGHFFNLTPEKVLEAVETSGIRCTGLCTALNSFENRVYDVELEEEPGVSLAVEMPIVPARRIVKFYRPGRWSLEQIREEHRFLSQLADVEIPAVGPLAFTSGETLHVAPETEIYFALFPKVKGRAPDELSEEQLLHLGRLLGRIHRMGSIEPMRARIELNEKTYGSAPLELLLAGKWIPLEIEKSYQSCVEELCQMIAPWLAQTPKQRIHGDCHLGNLIWNSQGPFFLDFDDTLMGPAVQDLWLLAPGRDPHALKQREILIEGYEQMHVFDRKTLALIEPLRALRMIHFSGWIARRWEDPAFSSAFPGFGTHNYWKDELENLKQQLEYCKEIARTLHSS